MSRIPFKNLHKGKRCFILGNGPGLNDVDLSLLKDEYTFGSNRIYLSGFIPTFYVACNPLVIEQFASDINALQCAKFIPERYADLITSHVGAPVYPIDTSLAEPMFSSPEGPMWEGHTVTYVALQLAYFMGFDEVILLGCDHDYGQLKGSPNEQQRMQGADSGHFHPDYFKGAEWNLPDLAMSELAYSLANAAYRKAGRRVVNASTRTQLKVFPLVNANEKLGIRNGEEPRVSAVVSAYKCGAEELENCLRDLRDQTLWKDQFVSKLEIIVVCQKGSDEHMAAGLDLSVTTISTPDIPTVYEAWNLGVKAACGRYITNANTDDRHHPRAFEIMADILDGRPDLDLVYHNSFITWGEQTYKEFVQSIQDVELVAGRQPGKPGFFAWPDYSKAALTRGCFIGPQPMWRRSLHQVHGYFAGEYVSAGDYEFWLRIAREANFFHIPLFLGLYRASETGIELSNPELSATESTRAWASHQTQGFDIEPVGPGALRVSLDGAYALVPKEEFLEMTDWLRLL